MSVPAAGAAPQSRSRVAARVAAGSTCACAAVAFVLIALPPSLFVPGPLATSAAGDHRAEARTRMHAVTSPLSWALTQNAMAGVALPSDGKLVIKADAAWSALYGVGGWGRVAEVEVCGAPSRRAWILSDNPGVASGYLDGGGPGGVGLLPAPGPLAPVRSPWRLTVEVTPRQSTLTLAGARETIPVDGCARPGVVLRGSKLTNTLLLSGLTITTTGGGAPLAWTGDGLLLLRTVALLLGFAAGFLAGWSALRRGAFAGAASRAAGLVRAGWALVEHLPVERRALRLWALVLVAAVLAPPLKDIFAGLPPVHATGRIIASARAVPGSPQKVFDARDGRLELRGWLTPAPGSVCDIAFARTERTGRVHLLVDESTLIDWTVARVATGTRSSGLGVRGRGFSATLPDRAVDWSEHSTLVGLKVESGSAALTVDGAAVDRLPLSSPAGEVHLVAREGACEWRDLMIASGGHGHGWWRPAVFSIAILAAALAFLGVCAGAFGAAPLLQFCASCVLMLGFEIGGMLAGLPTLAAALFAVGAGCIGLLAMPVVPGAPRLRPLAAALIVVALAAFDQAVIRTPSAAFVREESLRPGAQRFLDHHGLGRLEWVRYSQTFPFSGRQYAPGPGKGVSRVLFLGGSSTFGIGADDPATQSMPAQVERLLDGAGPTRVEVVNAGHRGYLSTHAYTVLRDEGVDLRPSVVVVHTGRNDCRHYGYPALPYRIFTPDELYASPVPLPWLRESGAGLLVVKGVTELQRLGTLMYMKAAKRPRVGVREYARNLALLIDLSREIGASPLLSVEPLLDAYLCEANRCAEYYEVMRQVAARCEVPLVEPGAGWRPAEAYRYFLDDVHLTAEGYRREAMAVAAAVGPLLNGVQPAGTSPSCAALIGAAALDTARPGGTP